MDNIFPIVLIGAFIIGMIITITNFSSYFKLPKLTQYTSKNPECRTNRGPKCSHCGSSSIARSYYGNMLASKLYKHSCRACGEILYRTSV